MRKSSTNRFSTLAVLLATLVWTSVHGADLTFVSGTSRSAVDDKILTEMFGGRVYLDESRNPERMTIVPNCPSMYGISEDHALYEYFVRWNELFNAHQGLLEDPAVSARLDVIDRQLVSELGYYATERDARIRVHAPNRP